MTTAKTEQAPRSRRMLARLRAGAMLASLGLAAAASPAAQTSDHKPTVTAFKMGSVFSGSGAASGAGVVIVTDGKITAVGPDLAIPEGATLIELPRATVTPGLIDANAQIESIDMVTRQQSRPTSEDGNVNAVALMFHSHNTSEQQCFVCSGVPTCAFANTHETLEPGQVCACCGYPTYQTMTNLMSGVSDGWSQTESSAEVVPHTRVMDGVNLRSGDFDRLVRGGVTTVFVSPDSAAVIGPRGAIVRTAGPIRDRVIELDGAVKGVMGSDSFNVGMGNSPPGRGFVGARTRRPNTRMGVTWVFRKAFYDAMKAGDGAAPTGADTPPAEAFPVLRDILAGKIGLRIQARQQSDILASIRLAKELKVPFTLLEATEGHKCLAELKAADVPVIFGPLAVEAGGPRGGSGETDGARLTTLRDLLDAGITTAISAQDLREEDGLVRQAMYAVRSGLSPDEALAAITSTPAKMLGIADQTGSLEAGKRADLVVWSGPPLEATSRPVLVMVGGRVVYDARDQKELAKR